MYASLFILIIILLIGLLAAFIPDLFQNGKTIKKLSKQNQNLPESIKALDKEFNTRLGSYEVHRKARGETLKPYQDKLKDTEKEISDALKKWLDKNQNDTLNNS